MNDEQRNLIEAAAKGISEIAKTNNFSKIYNNLKTFETIDLTNFNITSRHIKSTMKSIEGIISTNKANMTYLQQLIKVNSNLFDKIESLNFSKTVEGLKILSSININNDAYKTIINNTETFSKILNDSQIENIKNIFNNIDVNIDNVELVINDDELKDFDFVSFDKFIDDIYIKEESLDLNNERMGFQESLYNKYEEFKKKNFIIWLIINYISLCYLTIFGKSYNWYSN